MFRKIENLFFLSLTISLLIFSCQRDKIDHLKQSKEYFFKYQTTQNYEYLDSSYYELNLDKEFIEKGITLNNKDHIIPLLFNYQKYNELLVLMESYYQGISDIPRDELMGLNLIRYFNNPAEEKPIYDNVSIASKAIQENPKDSILYIEYYINKSVLVGRDSVIKEIDSLKNNNPLFSNMFYEIGVKKSILDFQEALPAK